MSRRSLCVALEMTGLMLHYDLVLLAERLAPVDRRGRALFALACSEALMPLYERLEVHVSPAPFATVRSASEAMWTALAEAMAPPPDLEVLQRGVEDAIPRDDEDIDAAALPGYFAVASLAYAVRTFMCGDVDNAVAASTQLYDAADFMLHRDEPPHTYVTDFESRPIVQLALRAIYGALDTLGNGSASELRAHARDKGERLAEFWFGA